MGIVDARKPLRIGELEVDALRRGFEAIGNALQDAQVDQLQQVGEARHLDADILEVAGLGQQLAIGGQHEGLHEAGRYAVDQDFEAQRLIERHRHLMRVDRRELRPRGSHHVHDGTDEADEEGRASPMARAAH